MIAGYVVVKINKSGKVSLESPIIPDKDRAWACIPSMQALFPGLYQGETLLVYELHSPDESANTMPIEAFHAINGKDAPVPEVDNA